MIFQPLATVSAPIQLPALPHMKVFRWTSSFRRARLNPGRLTGYAANAVESFASNVVGDGIKPSSSIADAALKEQLQLLWLAWTDDADAEGLTDFYGLQRRAAREVFLSGEVFLRIRPRRAEDGLTVPLQLQMLPSEMLPLDMNRTLPGAGLIRQGIEFDGIGRRVAYHFLRRHPGDLTDPGLAGETVRVPAADVIHVLDPVEAGQLRGMSRFTAAIVKLFTLDLYDDAELERKKIAAMFAMFITSPAPETPLEPTDEDLEVEPGQVVRLDPGEDVSTPATPDSGGTYELFQYRTLLQISAALGIPYGYLTGDTAKGNFSNTRISLIEFRRRISAWQHSVLVFQMCRAVWMRWLDTAVLSGALDLPDYALQLRRLTNACPDPTARHGRCAQIRAQSKLHTRNHHPAGRYRLSRRRSPWSHHRQRQVQTCDLGWHRRRANRRGCFALCCRCQFSRRHWSGGPARSCDRVQSSAGV